MYEDSPNKIEEVIFDSFDNKRFANLCGQFDENIKEIEDRLRINVFSDGGTLKLSGLDKQIKIAKNVIYTLYDMTLNEHIDRENVHIVLKEFSMNENNVSKSFNSEKNSSSKQYQIQTARKLIRARGLNQSAYLKNIDSNDLTLALAPLEQEKHILP